MDWVEELLDRTLGWWIWPERATNPRGVRAEVSAGQGQERTVVISLQVNSQNQVMYQKAADQSKNRETAAEIRNPDEGFITTDQTV